MQRLYTGFTLLSLLLSGASCIKQEVRPVPRPVPGEVTDAYVTWNPKVASTEPDDGSIGTKAVISNMDELMTDCQPGEGGNAIGFFSEYWYPGLGSTPDAFGVADTRLVYDAGGSGWKMVNNAGEEIQKAWVSGGRYTIRAFYPQKMYTELPAGASGTNANTFVLQYNTHRFQEDLMLAFNEVNTVDPGHPFEGNLPSGHTDDDTSAHECDPSAPFYADNNHSEKNQPSIIYSYKGGERRESHYSDPGDGSYHFSQAYNLADPVPLFFHHALAAIRLIVVLDYEPKEGDYVAFTGAYLSNDSEYDALHTTGLVTYGQSEPVKQWDLKDRFVWQSYSSAKIGEPFYQWMLSPSGTVSWDENDGPDGSSVRHTAPNGCPLTYSLTDRKVRGALAFTSNKNATYPVFDLGDDLNTFTNTTWHENPRTYLWQDGKESFYSKNDGWVLFIPQEYKGQTKLHLTFTTTTTSTTTTASFKNTNVPTYTTTDMYGHEWPILAGKTDEEALAYADASTTYYIKEWFELDDAQKLEHLRDKNRFNWFVPGKRYTYIAKLERSHLHMNVTVTPWKTLNSFDEIKFE